MKKFIVLSALAAVASTAFVACSSDDDLAQAPAVPEESVSEGTPLVIKIVGEDTRGTDWSSTNLPDKFTLFSTVNGGTTRWLGERKPSEIYTSAGKTYTKSGDEYSAGTVNWEDGEWDFYALSDATFVQEKVNPLDENSELQDAEHLDATSRNFTYTVPTDYNSQTDLLVAEALKQTKGNSVTLPFKHALAQIAQLEFKFLNTEDNFNDCVLVIKSVTLHNLKSTGKFTFPATWGDNDYKNCWSDQSNEATYHVELPQFELDNNKNYKIFDEENTTSNSSLFEYSATNFAEGTKRGKIDGLPNYFRTPAQGVEASYIIPLAKKTGSEGSYTGTDDFDATKETTKVYTAENATYTVDGGLYVVPQEISKTVWTKSSGMITGVTSGVYAEIQGIIFYETSTNPGGPYDSSNKFTVDNTYVGTSRIMKMSKLNNAQITQVLNHDAYCVHYWVPLSKAGKLKAGGRYKLTFNLEQAVSPETQDAVYAGVTIKD